MTSYRAYRSRQVDGKVTSQIESVDTPELADGDVLIATAWSGINYKDALAATGAGKIMKRFPLTVGIDAAGCVQASKDARFQPGDQVLVVGCGMGEEHDGGFAERVLVRGDWIVPVPQTISLRDAMAIGTAGFTAAMAVQRMEDNGLHPHMGPVAVNGATGGVGSLAISMLASRGYRVTAITGKRDSAAYLQQIGAADILFSSELNLSARPLEKAQWAGAVDNLGGDMLHWLCATMQPLGSIASIGLASSHKLNTTVMPFILRGVNLLGINSTYCPIPLREKVWQRLATDLRPQALAAIVQREVSLDELPQVFGEYLNRQVQGRTLVRIKG